MDLKKVRPCSPSSLPAAGIQGRRHGVADSAASLPLACDGAAVPLSAAREGRAGAGTPDGGASLAASGAGEGPVAAAGIGRAHTPTPLPADRTGIPGSGLPCLSSNNSITAAPSEAANRVASTLSPQRKKSACALAWNVQALAERHGLERLGFLTLTFAEHVLCPREAQRRLNSLASNVLRARYPDGFVRVLERQRSGRIHYHLLVVLPFDARSGVDFVQFGSRDYRSASAALRSEWAFWRRTARAYGFGRTELMPIRSTEEGIGRYVGKYIGKHHQARQVADKGVRLVEYSKGARIATTRFGWCTENGAHWRAKVRLFVQIMNSRLGVQMASIEDISKHLGARWAYHYREMILGLPVVTPSPGIGLLVSGASFDATTGECLT